MPHRTATILYVDDDPGLSRLVQKSLERRGYVFEHVADGEAALARIREGGIDVVGLDHHLPGGTGLDVLSQLDRMGSAPPVVYVTASAETTVAVAALKAGAFDYVSKSIADDFLELLGSTIDQAVERGRLLRAKERAEEEMREARERAEMLLREVNHRVANSLAMVAAMVRMQAHAVTDHAAKEALAETQARISAIAGVHKRLYNSEDVRFVEIDEYLANLVSELDTSIGSTSSAPRLSLALDPVKVPTDKAVSIGVITAELVTNAIKYAYPDGEAGEIRVLLAASSIAEAELAVEDDGVGWTGEGKPKGTGLGSRLIAAMSASLGTDIIYEARSRGTRAILRFSR